MPGSFNREDLAAGPRKKRKTTKVEKMKNAMKVLYEKYSAQ